MRNGEYVQETVFLQSAPGAFGRGGRLKNRNWAKIYVERYMKNSNAIWCGLSPWFQKRIVRKGLCGLSARKKPLQKGPLGQNLRGKVHEKFQRHIIWTCSLVAKTYRKKRFVWAFRPQERPKGPRGQNLRGKVHEKFQRHKMRIEPLIS